MLVNIIKCILKGFVVSLLTMKWIFPRVSMENVAIWSLVIRNYNPIMASYRAMDCCIVIIHLKNDI